ncbi:Vps71p NDAI_0I03030 [Naumovozyma dairenensis CBS 421]|uniref:HIT-type domain-containing protein n=1 Tax=Naumovozyma dairenensis (strain ATCC 10597 / BCRC 20456 / CBS 421 / NBRC 0211 / NRRL Y-12639) TaxID=1071378 RepID=G0WGG0_NAUDC|nr:hypothetical protein NDAI_0I03030 [Naumovozyma dairenensis CBS 421]CCD26871.1 hypothetical protein NDAI_0I03030 [Naumovozyma dairenensis CBS 421]
MVKSLVEEIDKKTYNPNVYFTSADPQSRSSRVNSKRKSSLSSGGSSRSMKRVNYSLADMESKLYTKNPDDNHSTNDNSNSNSNDKLNKDMLNKFTQQEIIQSKRRFMELDTENVKDLFEIPTLLSSITGINKDNIGSNSTTIQNTTTNGSLSRTNKNKFELPKNFHLNYRSTRLPKPKRKNTHRLVALKKTLTSKRPLNTYLDTLNQVDRSIILNNVYNKKYFKVLPLITICSICGGYNSISSCVKCSNKICSLRCYRLHNETRCIHR